jgi:hypothetical protein
MYAPARHRFSSPNPLSTRRSFLVLAAGGSVALATGLRFTPAAAQATFDGAQQINTTDATYEGGTYAVPADDGAVYHYATSADGYAYYNAYDGESWQGWTQAGDQAVGWDPAPVAYDGKSHAYYTGGDESIYQLSWDTYGDATWENVAGDYTFQAAPYATTYEDSVYLYGTATDGSVYHKGYDGTAWGDWQALNDADAPAKTDSKPYSVSWADHENTFWLGDDGYVYWNRYTYADGTWAGARQIPSDYQVKYVPWAVRYPPEQALYAYSANADGVPIYNVFTEADGWAGWQPIEASWTAASQPSTYYYEDSQHVVYVADGGNAYYIQYSPDGWADWQDLGGNYAYDSYQYEYNDALYLTYTGEDGGVYYKSYVADGAGAVEPTATEDDGY